MYSYCYCNCWFHGKCESDRIAMKFIDLNLYVGCVILIVIAIVSSTKAVLLTVTMMYILVSMISISLPEIDHIGFFFSLRHCRCRAFFSSYFWCSVYFAGTTDFHHTNSICNLICDIFEYEERENERKIATKLPPLREMLLECVDRGEWKTIWKPYP